LWFGIFLLPWMTGSKGQVEIDIQDAGGLGLATAVSREEEAAPLAAATLLRFDMPPESGPG